MPLTIPSPPVSVWYLGPVPIRAYALCMLAAIVVGWWITARRWRRTGGDQATLETVLTWAVAAGIVGARVYHVVSDSHLYVGEGRQWWRMFYIWEGGLSIWGAVLFGALAVWWQARRRGVSFATVADCAAVALPVGQIIARLGNWFNQELYGRPSTLPWAVEIDPAHRIAGYEGIATYHPAFLYEMVWNLGVVGALLWVERRRRLTSGALFALYVVLYTLGRFWIEALRIDPVTTVGGFRLNSYTSVIVFVVALAVLVWLVRNRPGTDLPAVPIVDTPARASALTVVAAANSTQPSADPAIVGGSESTVDARGTGGTDHRGPDGPATPNDLE